ncbi:DUF885 domain-containing protein [Polymorphobacter fuscus]|uniref:DUF885 family protein n=1 Tax=Sandarakinorhabdus fusca TaxID=1439888 RepID=A0A7C9GNV8_9SPHN|nr:DUF885 domain-containing protein [Polymorphobacter fuscus]KAB7647741.1 DUF885 domain-containing protein [Polymorphobacter fuscus]MQT17037.1 DUF885 family protein [Polymorphobacter fuscus]NJC08971.1 uncharacterized protein (DUF885 family) [Polymorphobacter fuscus]
MRHIYLLAAALILPAPLLAQAPAPAAAAAPAAKPATAADAELAAFFDAYDKAQLARSPQGQSYRGIKTDQDKWNDGSDAAAIRNHDADQKALADMRARFAKADLSPDSKLSYRLFEKAMQRRDAGFRFRHDNYVFDQMNGAQSEYPAFLINIHGIKTKADAQAYVARLQGIGPALDQEIATSETRARAGVMPPKWVYPYVINDARNTVKGAPFDNSGVDSPLLADFKAKVARLDIAPGEKDALVADATKALLTSVQPAYRRLVTAMEAQEKKAGTIDGIWRFKDGAAYYAANLANYTTTDMTAAQIHALGLAQVERIHGEMMEIARKTGFKGALPEFLAYMRNNKAFNLPEGEAGKAEYLKRANAFLDDIRPKLPQYFANLPKAPVVVKAVEPFREQSAGKAFYQSPAEDGSRPGTVYVNLYRMADMPTTEIEPLIYHEGLPGHHLERANSTELKNVPAFRKFGGFTAYSEGWGLYSEKLAKEMGQYADPNDDFGRLQLELHRAIRLVVDTGIHDKHWSREDAIKYLTANSAEPLGGIEKAIERYAVYPGQATAYMVGRLKISELRDRAEKALGPDNFDIRDFHNVVLKTGAVPLDILEENVDAWIASAKQYAQEP